MAQAMFCYQILANRKARGFPSVLEVRQWPQWVMSCAPTPPAAMRSWACVSGALTEHAPPGPCSKLVYVGGLAWG